MRTMKNNASRTMRNNASRTTRNNARRTMHAEGMGPKVPEKHPNQCLPFVCNTCVFCCNFSKAAHFFKYCCSSNCCFCSAATVCFSKLVLSCSRCCRAVRRVVSRSSMSLILILSLSTCIRMASLILSCCSCFNCSNCFVFSDNCLGGRERERKRERKKERAEKS